MTIRSLSVLLTITVTLGFTSCATLDDKPMKPKPYNPGDELSGRPQGQGYRPGHYATPFGLPMSN
jgi:hypothetical protein